MKNHIKEFAFPYGVIAGLIILLSGIIWLAVEENKSRENCVNSGHVYIEHHCYSNFPTKGE